MKINSYAVSSAAISEYRSETSSATLYNQNNGTNQQTGMLLQHSKFSSTTLALSYYSQGDSALPAGGNNGLPEPDAVGGKKVPPGLDKKPGDLPPGQAKKEDVANISDAGKKKLQEMQQASNAASTSKAANSKDKPFPTTEAELKLQILERILFYLDGQNHGFSLKGINERVQQLRQLGAEKEGLKNRAQDISEGANPHNSQAVPGQESRVIELNYKRISSTSESQTMSYASQGTVKTADGKEIAIDIQLNMSSEYTSSKAESGTVRLMDPLVINYGGNAASLTSTKYEFDLDFDGKKDKMSFAGEGSGFLALDKNGDGVINDGSELFGPSSGSGFGELAAYDKDDNMWIDENDDIYSSLRVWSKDADGKDQMMSLKDLDIGAIFLGATKTEFLMRDGGGTYNPQGKVQATSFFLKDSGGAGSIQHIDIAI